MVGAQAWLERSQALFADLRDAGLPTGLGEQLKVLRLLQLLEERGVAPDRPDALTHWIAPVLCTRGDQVKPLQRVLESHFAAMQRKRSAARLVAAVIERERVAAPARRFNLLWPIALIVATLAIGAAGFFLLQTRIAPAPAADAPAGSAAPQRPTSELLRTGGLVLGLLGVFGFLVYRRIRLAVRHGQVTGEGEAQQVRVDPPAKDEDNPQLLGAARVLNRPTRHRTRRLAVSATVRATARAGGRFSPVELIRRLPANWMLLVERGGSQDPLPAFGARLSVLLERSGVRHTLYEFRRSPEWVRRDDPLRGRQQMPLERALAADRPTRVLMLAEAGRTVDPDTGGPARWLVENDLPAPLVLLTPKEPQTWSEAEAQAAQAGVLVLSADADGLSSLARRIQADDLAPSELAPAPDMQFERWQAERFTWLSQTEPARAARDRLVATLRALLRTDEFRLLVGIAAFPQVRLDLMATLDRKLHPNDSASMQRARLLTLGRLVWVKEGIIPDWLRDDLMRALPPPELREVRERWIELLAEKPALDDAASALTIHLAEAGAGSDALHGDGLFLGFMQGAYDLPAPLRWIRLAGLWRAPDRTEIAIATAGVALAGYAVSDAVDVLGFVERGLRAWFEAVRNFQARATTSSWPREAYLVAAAMPIVVAFARFATMLAWQATPARAQFLYGAVIMISPVIVLCAWLGSDFETVFLPAAAARSMLAPVVVAAAVGMLLLWPLRPARDSAADLATIVQRSRGTGLSDLPTLIALAWLFVAGLLGHGFMAGWDKAQGWWELRMRFEPTWLHFANASLIAIAGLGLVRAVAISSANAALQAPPSRPDWAYEAALGLVFGQTAGISLAWMLATNLETLRGADYEFVLWHGTQALMICGAAAGLAAVLWRHHVVRDARIVWCGVIALVVHGIQAAVMAIAQSWLLGSIPLPVIAVFVWGPLTAIALFWFAASSRGASWRGALGLAVIGLLLASLGVEALLMLARLLAFFDDGRTWLPVPALVLAAVATWPLIQRATTDEPPLSAAPPGWRTRPAATSLWVAAPLVLLTALRILIGPLTLDLSSLVIPLAVWLSWQFGLRGFRTVILMLLPALWYVAPGWLTAFPAELARYVSPPTLDVAAAALILAALFARPDMLGQIRATARLPWLAVGALALALSLQIAGPIDPRSRATEPAASATDSKVAPPPAQQQQQQQQQRSAPGGGAAAPSPASPAAERRGGQFFDDGIVRPSLPGWSPAFAVVLGLFLLACTRLAGQAAAIVGTIMAAGLAALTLAIYEVALPPLLVPPATALAGLIAYGIGRYHERICRASAVDAATSSLPASVAASGALVVLAAAAGAAAFFAPLLPGSGNGDAQLALAMVVAWTAAVRAGAFRFLSPAIAGALAPFGAFGAIAPFVPGGLPLGGPAGHVFALFLPVAAFVVGSWCRQALRQPAPAIAAPPEPAQPSAWIAALYSWLERMRRTARDRADEGRQRARDLWTQWTTERPEPEAEPQPAAQTAEAATATATTAPARAAQPAQSLLDALAKVVPAAWMTWLRKALQPEAEKPADMQAASPQGEQAESSPDAPSADTSQSRARTEDDWCFTVGIGHYVRLPGLPGAISSASEFHTWACARSGAAVPEAQATMVWSGEGSPTAADAEKQLLHLVERARRQKAEGRAPRRLYLFFASYALGPELDRFGLVAANAGVEGSGVWQMAVKQWTDAVVAEGPFAEVLLFVDGWMVPADAAPPAEPLRRPPPRSSASPASHFYVMATQFEQQAVTPEAPLSVFATALLDGLRGAATNTSGLVTTGMLQSYLRYRMDEIPGSRPSPAGPRLHLEGDSDIVIVATAAASA